MSLVLIFALAIITWFCMRNVHQALHKQHRATLIDDIDRLLPQTQCGQCSYAGCRPYADTAHGIHKPPQVAWIRESECIGCTKCIQACPVDAIIGAPKLMHTVLADLCTGCELCIPPCPVDCIDLVS
jgi:Na+-translocating ferredoxin:NAD+ oxidoreductase subunit B